jgi:hypothetical protein
MILVEALPGFVTLSGLVASSCPKVFAFPPACGLFFRNPVADLSFSDGAQRLPHGAQRLPHGAQRLPHGAQRLPHGAQRLPHGAQRLPHGAQRLPHGAQRLLYSSHMMHEQGGSEENGCAGLIGWSVETDWRDSGDLELGDLFRCKATFGTDEQDPFAGLLQW